jgi:ubiquinone/menaquinone biosynthesis C-methylase UbiE
MDKLMMRMHFASMALFYKFRDLFIKPEKILNEARLEAGFTVLDYGCGPGGFSLAAAEFVGEAGRVYALDINPLAVARVKREAARKRLFNITTILSDGETGLEEQSVDVVLLYDVFHELHDAHSILRELHRVMRYTAALSVSDHHMGGDEIVTKLTESHLFELSEKNEKTYTFVKKRAVQ